MSLIKNFSPAAGLQPVPSLAVGLAMAICQRVTHRDAKDYAIEFGRYLARSATAHLQFMDASCHLRTQYDRASVGSHAAGLKIAIYEFEDGAPIASTKDAAILLARALARAAADYLEAVARCWVKTDDTDALSDHFRHLKSAIYEFEKRADRAAA